MTFVVLDPQGGLHGHRGVDRAAAAAGFHVSGRNAEGRYTGGSLVALRGGGNSGAVGAGFKAFVEGWKGVVQLQDAVSSGRTRFVGMGCSRKGESSSGLPCKSWKRDRSSR